MTARFAHGKPRATAVEFACALAVALASLTGCALRPLSAAAPDPSGDLTLRFIGLRTLEHRLQFGGTTVGGLSGIDYDPAADLVYLISDDRSVFSPARFYTARLTIEADRFVDVGLQTVVTLRGPDGNAYPPRSSDTEAIRYDIRTRTLIYTSEGSRDVKRGDADLIDPFVRRAGLDGRHLDEVPLPPMFRMTAGARGPRDNLVFEGATLSIDGEALWVSMEGPLLQDGPPPTMHDGAWSRFSRYDRTPDGGFGAMRLQVAYPLDPIPSKGALTEARAVNGVAEILASGETRMLVLERAFALGAGWGIRLYEADWAGATDVRTIDALADPDVHRRVVPMTKRLVFDFATLHHRIDNLEGLCFGPTLPNGHRTLVFVSDDNFNPGEVTQFLVFEVLPR